MQRPLAGEYAAGYQEYFDLVPQGDYLSLLKENTTETINNLKPSRRKNWTTDMLG